VELDVREIQTGCICSILGDGPFDQASYLTSRL
jgi:hypothetical protein